MNTAAKILLFLRNPAFGLIPLFVFSILIERIDLNVALVIALLLSVTGIFISKRQTRFLYDISIFTFIAALILNLLIPNAISIFTFFILIEVIFVLSLVFVRILRSKIIMKLFKRNNPSIRNFLNESFRVLFQVQYGFFLHLLIILLIFLFTVDTTPYFNRTIVVFIPQLIMLGIIIFEIIRLNYFRNKLNKEEWLPVVNVSGEVTGRLAKSVSVNLKNRYMHPVVRIGIIYKSNIFLKVRETTRILDPGKLDHPLETYIGYKQDVKEAVNDLLLKVSNKDKLPIRFLVKYEFENEITKRLIYLYIATIDEEESYSHLHLSDGRLWSMNQIEDNLGRGVFSENFELEYDYLKNTILLVQQLKEKRTTKF